MPTFLGRTLSSELRKLCAEAKRRRAAIAYCTDDSVVRFKAGDTLIVDASPEAIQTRQTSVALLTRALHRGVALYSHPSLHAKVVLADNNLIVGSANLSRSSQGLREAALVVTDRAARTEAGDYLDWLISQSQQLTLPILRRLAALPLATVTAKGAPTKPSLLEAVRDRHPTLSDMTFGWYSEETVLGERSIARAAKRAGLVLPRSSEWTWFESPGGRRVAAAMKQACQGRPQISWKCKMDKDQRLLTFKAHDSSASLFLGAVTVGNMAVSLISLYPATSPFALSRDRATLATILNKGYERMSRLQRRAVNNPLSIISPKQLRTLYELGSKESAV